MIDECDVCGGDRVDIEGTMLDSGGGSLFQMCRPCYRWTLRRQRESPDGWCAFCHHPLSDRGCSRSEGLIGMDRDPELDAEVCDPCRSVAIFDDRAIRRCVSSGSAPVHRTAADGGEA